MNNRGENILTHSRRQSFKTCRRKHQYEYELGVRRERSSNALRFGGWFHQAIDWLAQGMLLQEICDRLRQAYREYPEWCTTYDNRYDWQIECEKLVALVFCYEWRWRDDDIEIIATEQSFLLPIRNPETGRPTPNFIASGKIDKIIRIDVDKAARPEGRKAVMEHKTTGDSIKPESDYWKRTRLDHQVTSYFWAARELEYDVETIIYDVIRKPGIGPHRATPPDKRKYTKKGTLYASQRETDELPAEYGLRLIKDIQSRHDFYFQRQEVPRTQDHVNEFLDELWQEQKTIQDARNNNRHFRNTSACTQPYRCEYLDICQGENDLSQHVPEGFVRLNFLHPELEENVNDSCTATAQ